LIDGSYSNVKLPKLTVRKIV